METALLAHQIAAIAAHPPPAPWPSMARGLRRVRGSSRWGGCACGFGSVRTRRWRKPRGDDEQGHLAMADFSRRLAAATRTRDEVLELGVRAPDAHRRRAGVVSRGHGRRGGAAGSGDAFCGPPARGGDLPEVVVCASEYHHCHPLIHDELLSVRRSSQQHSDS